MTVLCPSLPWVLLWATVAAPLAVCHGLLTHRRMLNMFTMSLERDYLQLSALHASVCISYGPAFVSPDCSSVEVLRIMHGVHTSPCCVPCDLWALDHAVKLSCS